MKVIDILNKIANGEEVPKKIRYQANSHKMDLYTYNEYTGDYQREIGIDLFTYLFSKERILGFLNDEVEIPKEDKKIEKIEIEQDTPNSNFYIRDKNGTKCALTKHSKIIAYKINEIIDYLNKENK